MKFLLLVVGMATALTTSASVAFASGGFAILKTHGIGLLYHGCLTTCEPDADVTITNNSGKFLRMTINGHRLVVQPHHDMEVSL